MKEMDPHKSASQKNKADRRKGHDRRKTPPNPWASSDIPSTRDELAGLVREIVDTQGSGIKSPGAKFRRKNFALAGAIVLALTAAPVAWALWPRTVEIPDGMVGRWTTTALSYADRSFTIARDSVTFLTSAQDSTSHPITDVRSKPNERGTAYTIYYASFGADLEFSVVYDSGPDPTLQFINQQGMIWRKER